MASTQQKILIALILIVVLAAILRIALVKRPQKTTQEKIAIPVEVVTVKKTDVKETCTIVGTITADKTVQVFPETMGRVTEILVKEGSRVKKGEQLAAIKNETVGFEFEQGYVTSPINGTVAKILVDIGSTVAPQMPVAMVVDISRIKVSFNAPEMDAQCFKVNGAVTVYTDALPDKKFSGNISEISPVIDPLTKTVAVKAIIARSGASLKPGMTARILVNLGERPNVIAIPADAIIDNSVFVVKNDSTAERRGIKLGLAGDKWVEITEGLSENELIVVLGQQRLVGGEKVNPIVRER